jgi:hypothetical protein
MYPSIMASCAISPECIDYVTSDNHGYATRFSYVGFCSMYSKRSLDGIILSCIVYGGIDIRVPNAPESSIMIGESIGVDAYHDMSYESILAILTEKVRSSAFYE